MGTKFNKVVEDVTGKEVLEAKPLFDTTMVVRKSLNPVETTEKKDEVKVHPNLDLASDEDDNPTPKRQGRK
jgi:hypothetical protein